MISTISEAIQNIAPGTEWVCYGDYPDYMIEWINPTVAPVTNAQIDAEYQRLLAQAPIDACKAQAMSLLAATDWVNQPDVRDTANSPYLANAAEFDAYRLAVRQYAVYPVADPVWPTLPTEQWSA